MADKWSIWRSDLEQLTPFAEEWKEGRVEDFIRGLLNNAARKRQQRDALLALVDEVRNLHATYRRLLAFFDLERACQSWSAENCSTADVERVLTALTDWRDQILRHSGRFPPAEADTRTLAALEACMLEAQAAADAIRPCFGVLDAALSSEAAEPGSAEPAEAPPAAAADPVPSTSDAVAALEAPEGTAEPVAAELPAGGQEEEPVPLAADAQPAEAA